MRTERERRMLWRRGVLSCMRHWTISCHLQGLPLGRGGRRSFQNTQLFVWLKRPRDHWTNLLQSGVRHILMLVGVNLAHITIYKYDHSWNYSSWHIPERLRTAIKTGYRKLILDTQRVIYIFWGVKTVLLSQHADTTAQTNDFSSLPFGQYFKTPAHMHRCPHSDYTSALDGLCQGSAGHVVGLSCTDGWMNGWMTKVQKKGYRGEGHKRTTERTSLVISLSVDLRQLKLVISTYFRTSINPMKGPETTNWSY